MGPWTKRNTGGSLDQTEFILYRQRSKLAKGKPYEQNGRSQEILLDSSIRAADVWRQSVRKSAGWACTTPRSKGHPQLFRAWHSDNKPTNNTDERNNTMTTTFPRTLHWLGALLLLTCALTVQAGASGGPAPLPGPTGISLSSSGLPIVK